MPQPREVLDAEKRVLERKLRARERAGPGWGRNIEAIRARLAAIDGEIKTMGIIPLTPLVIHQTPHIPSHSLINMFSCPRSSAVERST